MNENLAGRKVASDMPLVSIVIPVYNGVNYMREAIDSALAQTYPNIEILVINDGSTDDTEKVALSYGNKIRYFSQKNGGQSAALNRGIDEMKGEYFSWLSHDDVYDRRKVELQISILSEYGYDKKYFVYSDYEVIRADGTKCYEVRHDDYNARNFVFKLLMIGSIYGCSVMAAKESICNLSKFNLSRPHTSDIELFVRMGQKLYPIRVGEILVKSRAHEMQASIAKRRYHARELGDFGKSILREIDSAGLCESAKSCGYDKPYDALANAWSQHGIWRASYAAIALSSKTEHNIYGSFALFVRCIVKYCYKKGRRELSWFINKKYKIHG